MTSDTDQRPANAPVAESSRPRAEYGEEDSSTRAPRQRGQANLERAHKTVNGMVEAAPGAPRSGSA